METIFAAARIILSLAVLLYASWSDYKAREVSNRVWTFYAPIAVLLSLTELLLYYPSKLPLFGLSFGITTAIALVLFYSGGFGGADSKALMCIALALPFFPQTIFNPIVPSGNSPLSQILFPLTIFSNAILFAAASGIYLFLYNIIWHKINHQRVFAEDLSAESIGKKLVVLITGYKLPIAKVREKWHIYPMEDLRNENDTQKRKLIILPRDEGRNKIVERLSKAVDNGKIDTYVWATPGLPMLIFITAGLIIALFFGDIVWVLINSLLG